MHRAASGICTVNNTSVTVAAFLREVIVLFATLFGLEVSPRKTRECTKFWGDVKEIAGNQVRDNRWEDPALLPTTDDIHDAKKFLESTTVPDDLSGLL